MTFQKNRGLVDKLIPIGRYVLMIWLALIFALPIIYMVVSSLKPVEQILRDTSSIRAFLPVGSLSFANYEAAFSRTPLARFLLNSVLISALTVISGLWVNSMAGFALSRLKWKGQYIILAMIIAMIIIPFETIAIPLLLVVNNLPWFDENGLTLGWFNSYQVQIVPFIANAFSIYLFFQFFKDLPGELFDAARIDGATWFQVFVWIVIPLSKPVYATVAILHFLAMWNQYLWPSLVIRTDEYRPIMVGFGYFGGRDGVSMAYLTIAVIPVLILFFAFQHAFIRSIGATYIQG
ncbi:MAG: carbohydrate ABC transporter permease [Anaerolineae bacterium]|nr:carbohydrate ABC transporter permease [Anaerolineae bacterium]